MSTNTTPAATLTAPEPITTHTLTITNVCQCMWCPQCCVGTADADPCQECNSATEPFDCGGDCYTDAIDVLTDITREWAALNPAVDNEWVITGEGMGWRHVSGQTSLDLTRHCASQAIGVNSEWTQTWTVEVTPGGEFTAVQSHHDAMGEAYKVYPRR